MGLLFQKSYLGLPSRLYEPTRPTPVASPSLLVLNRSLGEHLGLAPGDIDSESGVQIFSGNRISEDGTPVAMAYAGHQFGNLVPRLGDGRAILLGELKGKNGRIYDVQLKGSGPTPFSRGGDGRAALGPVLREYLVSEAMAALGVPTTRSLCAVATGEWVYREIPLPGAVLTRVALSHLRIGTFEYLALAQDYGSLRSLVNYALARLYPSAQVEGSSALTLLRAVIQSQASLIAQWMSFGFVHGVMNTDNMSISGETIDYGPCAFLDAFSFDRVFSSIDRHGRYAFGRQPSIGLWNLTRLAECLLPLVSEDFGDEKRATAELTELLQLFSRLFEDAYIARFRDKLGLKSQDSSDPQLVSLLCELLDRHKVDFTLFFRRLTDFVESDDVTVMAELFVSGEEARVDLDRWLKLWKARLDKELKATSLQIMQATNPRYIPRNHRVEEAIRGATSGDLSLFLRLLEVVTRPYGEVPGASLFELPPGEEQWRYRTFCGT